MGMIPVDNLEVGMVLEEDVLDRTGRLLLGAGVELTQKHLMIFRTWGIDEVNILGAEGGDQTSALPDEVTAEDLAAAEAELLPRFRHTGLEFPIVRELLRLAALKKVLNGVL